MLVGLFGSFASCGNPGKQAADLAAEKSKEAARAAATAPQGTVPPHTDSDVPVSQMRVNGETFGADVMWKEIADEILLQRENQPPPAFGNWLQQRAAQWIADKISESLLYQQAALRLPEGAQKNIDAVVDSQLRKTITEQWDGVQRRYERQLLDQGRSLADVRERLRREIMVGGYLEGQIQPLVAEPTRDELMAIYQANVDSWKKPERRSMSLIEVRVLDFLPQGVTEPTREQSQAARTAARDRLEDARRLILSGTPFAEVARTYSSDSRAPEGGAWGWIKPEDVREKYLPAVQALSQLKTGEVSDVIPSGDSFFLVRCDEHDPGLSPKFADVQDELMRQHRRIAYNRKVAELIRELQSTARIEPEGPELERFHTAVVAAANERLTTIAPSDRRGGS